MKEITAKALHSFEEGNSIVISVSPKTGGPVKLLISAGQAESLESTLAMIRINRGTGTA